MDNKKFSLIDLAPISEPISKLIETVGTGVGVLYEPTKIVRKAKAEVKADKIRLEGELDLAEIENRATLRVINREIRRQHNLESIIDIAVDQLPESVDDKQVDDDWVVHFLNYSQEISDKELQGIWARVLAGEVASPTSFSLRTLQTIKNLNPGEANWFQQLCSFIWEEGTDRVYMYTIDTDALLSEVGLTFSVFMKLENLGLINFKVDVGYNLGEGNLDITYFDKKLTLSNEDPKKRGKIVNCHSLTDVGIEIYNLCDKKPNDGYYNLLVNHWQNSGVKIN